MLMMSEIFSNAAKRQYWNAKTFSFHFSQFIPKNIQHTFFKKVFGSLLLFKFISLILYENKKE